MTASRQRAARGLRHAERSHLLVRLVVIVIVLLAFGRAGYQAVVLTEQALRLSRGALR